jgi:hypothetical protein
MIFKHLELIRLASLEKKSMFGKMKTRVSIPLAPIAILVAFLAVGTLVHAQAAKNLLGTVSAIKAVSMQYSELAVGDHVLVSIDPNSTGSTAQALRIIAIKAADVTQQQQAEAADWQKRGLGGLIKSVDNASGDIVVSNGAGTTAKTITIHTTKATVLKRYAPASISYASAQIEPFNAIQAGDQLMARGTKNADGTQMDAEEVVTGSFRNIAGTITSLDANSQTLVVKDLSTKKQVTIHVPADAQMKKLPDNMAQMLATRLKGAAGGNGGGGGRGGQGGEAAGGGGPGGGPGGGGGRGNMDPQQILSRAPAIHLADLQKGDAVMLVSSTGTTDVTAITLIAGVEPILEAPAGQDLLSNWSMSAPEGGGAD